MASTRVMAARRTRALSRLSAAKEGIRQRFGVEVTEQPITNRDADLAQVQQLENVVGILEAVLEATQDTASQDTASSEPADGENTDGASTDGEDTNGAGAAGEGAEPSDEVAVPESEDEAEESSDLAPDFTPNVAPDFAPDFASVLIEAVGATKAQALLDAGFDSAASIAAASDEELRAVHDIGPATVEKLRTIEKLRGMTV